MNFVRTNCYFVHCDMQTIVTVCNTRHIRRGYMFWSDILLFLPRGDMMYFHHCY